MRAVIQRVKNANVVIDGKIVGRCGIGFMILFCAVEGDTESDVELLAKKTANLRVFEDENCKMNKSILDIDGEILCISQFTLAADTKKGNRPSYIHAAGHDVAIPLYDKFCERMQELVGREVKKGVFGADMQVSLVNDGPVTIILDTDVWNKKG